MKKNILIPLSCAAALTLGAMTPIICAPQTAAAQTVTLDTQETEINVGLPFLLSVTASDFDESPQPEIDPFEITDGQGNPAADVQLVGISPQISSMTQIFNGKMTRTKEVKFIINFKITPKTVGTYTIPAIRVSQGAKSASSPVTTFTAKAIEQTEDMKIELKIPERKYWVGETIEATLIWYLRRDVGEHSFDVPMLKMPEYFDVQEPDNIRGMRQQGIVLEVGTHQAAFPYTTDNAMLNGIQYNRIQIPIRITPLKSGVISIPASGVSAELVAGMKRDMWGFGERSYKRYRAEDKARTCEIMELPQATKPAAFSNAMGSEFSIDVKADRTIVKAGDPVVLTIDISSPDSMNGLILPSLVSAGLNEQLFGISTEDPVAENIDGGAGRNIRRFEVPIRIKSERVTEIPPLAFSYFNPKTGEYSTVRSQAIALSVSAVDKISASDVFSAKKVAPSANKDSADNQNAANNAPNAVEDSPALGRLELSLNSTPETLNASERSLKNIYIRSALYIMPFLIWIAIAVIRRSRKSRAKIEVQRNACLELKKAISQADEKSARDAAADISNKLNAFLSATETPQAPFAEISEKMQSEAYNPNAQKLSESIKKDLTECIKKNVNPVYSKLVSSIFAIFLAIVMSFMPQTADAQNVDDQAMLNQSVEAYRSAMNTQDRAERTSLFKQAYAQFNALAERYPDSVDLQLDAGNSALNAADFGHAALAYKRALNLDPSLTQAQNNLAYIQSIQGDVSHDSAELISSAVFLEQVPVDTRLFIAAILFAIGILLIIPWSHRTNRVMHWIAILPLVVWLWLIIGVFASPDKDEAVVMNECFLKTADSSGAPNVSSTALMPGYTVEIIQSGAEWQQVKFSGNVQGWLKTSDIERVRVTR